MMLRSLLPSLNVLWRHPWATDCRVRLNLRRHLTYWKRGLAAYEPHVARLLLRVVGPEDDVVEVGTHVGFFTMVLASRARSVLALEPDELNLGWTRENLERNGFRGVRLLPCAAGDVEGKAPFRVDRATGSTGRLDASAAGDAAVQVQVFRLDGLLREPEHRTPGFVKIDAEGAEDRVLVGMGALLESGVRVLVEVGEETKHAVQERLRRHGYRLFNPHSWSWQPPGTLAGWHVYGTKREEPALPTWPGHS